MGDLKDSSTPASRQVVFREDFWTEEATSTLVGAWGRRYLDLNRGNMRQKDWQEVADAVNSRHGHTEKTRRSDVQCKNRIDTLKKKYKVEKARITESDGNLTSPWPFYPQLEMLIGSNGNKHPNRPTTRSDAPAASSQHSPPLPPLAVPLPYGKPVSLPMKRLLSPIPSPHESHLKKNYSAIAAAAAAVEEEPKEDDSELEGEEAKGYEGRAAGEGGMMRLAKAIQRFGQVFERVESMKQRQMIELEKQRMQFANELEVQKMQLFMDAQLQLEKMKHTK